jgi:peptidoglycan/LPS O-acetylase OafA/YrhL
VRPSAPARADLRNRPPRLAVLDLLRFLAALAVVAYHYTAFHHGAFGVPPGTVFPTVGKVTGLGALGVELFFVISGFVILMSVWGRSAQEFVASRIARLFPAYWVAVVLMGAMMVFAQPGILRVLYGPVTLSDVLGNLTMVQTALGVKNIDGVYWTLFAELRFYVSVGLLALIGLNRNRVIAFAVFWPILGELANSSSSPLAASLLGGRFAAFFAAGMLLYVIYREGHSALLWLLVGLQWALAMRHASTDLVSAINGNTGRHFPPVVVMTAVTLAFVAVALATLSPLSRISWRALPFLGALTYPLYLLHENWGWVLISVLHDRIGQWPAVLVAAGIVLAASTAVHVCVEKPLAPLLRRVVRNGLTQPPTELRTVEPADIPSARSGELTARLPGLQPAPAGEQVLDRPVPVS